jgi:hypothetical protein
MVKIWPALTDNGRLSPDESAVAHSQLTAATERPGTVAEIVHHFISYGLTGSKNGKEDDDTGGSGGQQQQQNTAATGGGGGASAAAAEAAELLKGLAIKSSAPSSGTSSPLRPIATAAPAGALARRQSSGAAPGSGAASPTAASERSSVAHASMSTVPFSFLARQRRHQQHEEMLDELSSEVVADAAAAFDARMRAANCELELLQGADAAAAAEYERAADIAAALAKFSGDLSERQSAAAAALALAPQLLGKLSGLQSAVAGLEASTKALEKRVAGMAREQAAAERGRSRGGGGAAAAAAAAAAASASAGGAEAAAPAAVEPDPSSSSPTAAAAIEAKVAAAAASSITATVTAGASAGTAAAAAAAAAVTSRFSTLVGGIGDGGAAAYKMVVGSFSGAAGGGASGGGAQGGGGVAGEEGPPVLAPAPP